MRYRILELPKCLISHFLPGEAKVAVSARPVFLFLFLFLFCFVLFCLGGGGMGEAGWIFVCCLVNDTPDGPYGTHIRLVFRPVDLWYKVCKVF